MEQSTPSEAQSEVSRLPSQQGAGDHVEEQMELYQGNQLLDALNSVAEASATIVPLIALILGIGMMQLLPPRVSTPLFASSQEAFTFYSQHNLTSSLQSPIMLVSAQCASCKTLQQQLYSQGIGFEMLDVGSPAGAALYNQSQRVASSRELPIVVIGTNLVRPDAAAVKRVMGQNR